MNRGEGSFVTLPIKIMSNSEKELKDEKNDIAESMSDFNADAKYEGLIKSSRFEKELKDIKIDPILSVRFLEMKKNKWVLEINPPAESVYYGGKFIVHLIFSNDYPFTAPLIRF